MSQRRDATPDRATQKALEDILVRLREDADGVERFLDKDADCVAEITSLAAECADTIIDCARHLLDQIERDEHNEYCFQVFLRALVGRGQQGAAFELAAEALLSERAEDKNFYVTLLVDVDYPGTPEVLIKALGVMESFDELGGHAQEAAIEHLMSKGAEDAYPVVVKCLLDVSARVRATALQFIRKFDKQESAACLVQMLAEEDWEYNILLVLELLKKWRKVEFLAELTAYSQEEFVDENPDIKQAIESTLAALSPARD